MQVRTREHSPEKTKLTKIESFRRFMENESLENILIIFLGIPFLVVSLFIFIATKPFLESVMLLGILIGIIAIGFLIKIFFEVLFESLFGIQPYNFKQGRLHPELKEAIQNTNLRHHWNFRREIGIERKFKKFLFFDLIGVKIILFFVFFILLSLIFPPKIIIFPYILTIPLYMRKFLSFHFHRKRYQVIVLKNNPQSYYWDKNTLYLY